MDIFLVLSDPVRRHILELLADFGQLSASNISQRFEISQPAVSQHLKVLRQAGLVKVQRVAQFRLYQLQTRRLQELTEWIAKVSK